MPTPIQPRGPAAQPQESTQFGGATIGFLDNSRYDSSGNQLEPPTTVPAPAVYSSNKFVDTTKNSQAKLAESNAALQGTLQQPNLVKQPDGSIQPVQTNQSQTSQPKTEAAPKTQEQKYADDQLAAIDAETNSYVSLLDNRMNSLNAANAAMIEQIKANYARRKEQMKQINQATLEGQRTAGIRAGRQRYANEIETSILSAEERAGIERLAALDAEELSLIQQAQSANDEKQFSLLNQRMSALSAARKEKDQVLQTLYQNSLQQEKLLMEKAQAAREDIRLQKELQEYEDKRFETNRKFLLENGIDQPYYWLGDLAINSATGEPEFRNVGGEFQTLDGYAFSSAEEFFQAAGINSFDQIQTIQRPRFSKDNIFGSADAGYFSIDPYSGQVIQITEPQIKSEYDELLSPTEAANLGVPYGTTKGQAAAYGINPRDFKLDEKTQARVDRIVSQFDDSPIVKKYNTMADGFNFAQSIDKNTRNPADQQALIYAFAKAMDPESVVREGEYATVQKYATSWLKSFGFNAQRVIDEGAPILTPTAIESIQKTIASKFESVEKQYINATNEFGKKIDRITGQDNGTDYLADYGNAYIDGAVEDISNQLGEPESKGFVGPIDPRYNERGGMSPANFTKAVTAKYPTGYKGGQCGTFAHKLVDFPPVGNSKREKINAVQKYGVNANQWRNQVRIGDVIITDENPTYGHVAVVNAILPNGKIRVTESNFKQSERVSHDRVLSINDKKIYGAIRGKPKVNINRNVA